MADTQRTDPALCAPDERRFGYWAGHFVVVGSMIGTGILTTSGTILQKTGNPPALLGLWALGGIIALCGAVTVAELATALPRPGGDYIFVREAYGRGAGFISGWATCALGFAAPVAVAAHAALTYLITPYKADLAGFLPAWIAVRLVPLGASALILVVAAVHARGHRHSARLQGVATMVTAGVLLALALGGILFGRGDWNHLSAGGWPSASELPVLAPWLILVAYSYSGWNGAAYLAGELRNPARTLPRCLVGGAVTVIILYLAVNLAFVYALDPDQLKTLPEETVRPVAELATGALFGPAAARVVGASLGLCLVATVSAYVLTGPRVALAMARDGVFPAFAARLHPTHGTPAAATLALGVVSAGLVWAGSLEELLDYASVGLAALTGLTVASVFPLRRRADLPHPYRLPLYPLPPLVFLAFTVAVIGSVLADDQKRESGLWSLATLVIGLPLSRLFPAHPSAQVE